jgi:tRNA/rRNA methyltransferase
MNKKKRSQQIENFQETYINENYKNLDFTVVLVQTETAGNIGSVCRVMKNFGFNKLTIFNPIESVENITNYETQGFAMHGKDILKNSNIIISKSSADHIHELTSYLNSFDLIIGTTAKGKKYINIKRIAMFPEDFSLPISEKPLQIAILFGRESRGLNNDEIRLCDVVLRIPTYNEYPTLNLSHACGIILYEFFKKINVINIGRGNKPVLLADREERAIFYSILETLLKTVKIKNFKQYHALDAFRNIIERSFMSKKELSLILGFFSKLKLVLDDSSILKK